MPHAVTPAGVTFRRAEAEDVDAIVGIFTRSRAVALPFLPKLHSAAEDRAFFSGLLETGTVTLASAARPVGFMAETEGWIEHLYLDPEHRGRGIGDALMGEAMARQGRLQLWCFAQNHPARRFYERLGFSAQRHTDGDNEEGLPDILYVWQREPAETAQTP